MRKIELYTSAFQDGTSQEESHAILYRLLEALVELDLDYLTRHPDTPSLFRSGVRYQREPVVNGKSLEQWRTIPVIRQHGNGDCEDLAAWRVAELRKQGVAAQPCFTNRRVGQRRVYHIVVCLPNGLVEDVSRVLGMGWDQSNTSALAPSDVSGAMEGLL